MGHGVVTRLFASLFGVGAMRVLAALRRPARSTHVKVVQKQLTVCGRRGCSRMCTRDATCSSCGGRHGSGGGGGRVQTARADTQQCTGVIKFERTHARTGAIINAQKNDLKINYKWRLSSE